MNVDKNTHFIFIKDHKNHHHNFKLIVLNYQMTNNINKLILKTSFRAL